MAYSESPFSSSSSSYDVFLSFRGEDTRKQFTGHLHSALEQAGIHTFRDDNEIPRGEEISPQLLRAIEGSRISVVVFSRNYASSTWCLDELVKIMECRKKSQQVVIPVFYDTDPSDVRKQTGSYAKAFDEHEEHFKEEMEKVNRWREALTQAANLAGRVLHETNGYEAELIKRVVDDVDKLRNKPLHVAEHPVGISSKEMVRTHYVVPSDPLCLDHGRYNDQPYVPSASNDVILNDVQNMVRGRNPSETRGAPLLTGSTKLVGRAFEENRNKIWSWLRDDEVSAIGIYGMGGTGKTTMLEHIHNELLQSPHIFHHVYWVTLSRDFSVPELQKKIAGRIKLSFSNEEGERGHRAEELWQELMKKQRWILILDDLWDFFDLRKVGIPLPFKGCKLILTTRSEEICKKMTSENKVRVNPLSNEEAWTLFMEELGHNTPLSPQVERVARDITRECAGLPLGIKTIAGTMKGVDGMHEWSNTLEELKQSKVPQVKVEEEVFRILRFSYTRLNDKDLKKCFLYCGLFPEDFEIPREDLIDFLIDEGVVKCQTSRDAEINKGRTMLDRLEKACLLERLRGGSHVKMHDLIRDMAIQKLEKKSRAIVKAGAQLKELPDAEEWSEELTRVSLMHNQIKKICSRHSPRCPQLSTLLLCQNFSLSHIADSFFKHLHGLKVLDLSGTPIGYLPHSVCDLTGLTSLLLKNCWNLRYVPSFEKLRALKRLDLSSTPLEKIPHGMECLSNLRYLRMGRCGQNKFPGGILPKLSNLQVFILEEWFLGKYVGKEVGCLRKLESLECHFEDQSNYSEYLKSRDATQTLKTYKIVVGLLSGNINPNLKDVLRSGTKLVGFGYLDIIGDRDFRVISSNDIQQLICECINARSIRDVLPSKYSFGSLKLLCCYHCKSMKKLFPSVLLPNLVNLEDIRVENCEEMEEIIEGTRSDEEGAMGEESNKFQLPKLRKLTLSNLPKLRSICSAKLICNSLQVIEASNCNSMEILVPSSWNCLLNLESIVVSTCEKMQEIIGGTRSDEEGVMGEESSEFNPPKLISLKLIELPELKSICSTKLICVSLKEILVYECNSMEILFPSSWSCLLNLEEIIVKECEKMEEIIGGTRSNEEGVMGEESSEFKLPKLRKLTLSNLPELKSISSAKRICNSLENIDVYRCNSIEILFPSSWSCLLNLEEIIVEECEKMEEIIGGTRSNEEGVMGEERISSEFKLPKLRKLKLRGLPELKSICRAKERCDSLEAVRVFYCEKLKRIPICLPLLENGEPSPPASLKKIRINSKEWWESTVEWEHPNAKDVLRPFVRVKKLVERTKRKPFKIVGLKNLKAHFLNMLL